MAQAPEPAARPSASGSEPRTESADSTAIRAMREAPLAAALATTAALLDLAWNRIGVRLVDGNSRELWIPLVSGGRVLRNLAGVAGLVAATAAVASLVRVPSPAEAPWRHLFSRLTLAGLAGLYLPGVAILLVTPRERVPGLVVVLGLLSSNAIVATLGASSLSLLRAPAARASALSGLTALLAMLGLLIASLRTIVPALGTLGIACRHGAELAWLATPLVLLSDPELVPTLRRHRARAFVAAISAALVLGLALVGQAELGDGMARIAYGGFRTAMLPEPATWLYAVPIGVAIGLGALHCLDPHRRQLGLAIACWVAAGLSPRSPPGMLAQALGALLLARAALVSHPQGRSLLIQASPEQRLE